MRGKHSGEKQWGRPHPLMQQKHFLLTPARLNLTAHHCPAFPLSLRWHGFVCACLELQPLRPQPAAATPTGRPCCDASLCLGWHANPQPCPCGPQTPRLLRPASSCAAGLWPDSLAWPFCSTSPSWRVHAVSPTPRSSPLHQRTGAP